MAMTNSEIKYVIALYLATWVPAALLLGWLVGYTLIAFAVGVGMVFVSMWITGKRLRAIKRGKPKQYHVMRIKAFLQDRGLMKKTMIREKILWDIRRRQKPQRREAPAK